MQQRNIATSVILSIVTCGIYALYWMVCITDDSNALSQAPNPTSGVTAVILSIVTCGLYSIYWAYKMGERLDAAASQRNQPTQNRSVLYLVLQVVGLGLIGTILMQSAINDILEAQF